MTDESDKPAPDQPKEDAAPASRDEMMAAIKARADALRAAKAAGGGAAPAAPSVPAEQPAPEAQAAAETPEAAAEHPKKAAQGEVGPEASREDKLAAVKARAEALRAAKAAGGGAAPAAAPSAAPARAAAAPASLDVPVSSLNPGGRPGAPPRTPALEAFGTLNQSVEIRGDAGENENLKKLLGGLGAYQNPLRSDSWQIDYRYYAAARARLEAAGYTLAEKDFLGRPIAAWSPTSRGWTLVEE